MSDTFNPYHRWLGIPSQDQPPDHYRLLGVERFESDIEVIRDASERQTAHVRRYASGEHRDLANHLLGELATARACLVDPLRKSAYDQQLHAQIAAQNPPPVATPIQATASVPRHVGRQQAKSPLAEVVKIVTGGIAGLAVGVVLLWYGFGVDLLGVMQHSDYVPAYDLTEKTTVPKSTSQSAATPAVIKPDVEVVEPVAKPLAEQPSPGFHQSPGPPFQSKTGVDPEVQESGYSRIVNAWLIHDEKLAEAKATVLDQYAEEMDSLGRNGKLTEVLAIRHEMNAFKNQSILIGRGEMTRAFQQYGRAVMVANAELTEAYKKEINDYKGSPEHGDVVAYLSRELTEVLNPPLRLISLRFRDRPTLLMRHEDYLCSIGEVCTDEHRMNSTFEVVPGLSNSNYVSFRAINVPSHYISHGDFRLRLTGYVASEGFRQNATFKQVPGLANTESYSFESVNFPLHYIAARGNGLFIEKNDGTDSFKENATFEFTEPQFEW